MTEVLFATLIWKVVDFLRLLVNIKANASAVLTQLTAWTAGVIVVLIGAHASVAANVTIPGFNTPLARLDGASIVLVGLSVASVASAAVDVKQAVDNKDSAAKPPLLK